MCELNSILIYLSNRAIRIQTGEERKEGINTHHPPFFSIWTLHPGQAFVTCAIFLALALSSFSWRAAFSSYCSHVNPVCQATPC